MQNSSPLVCIHIPKTGGTYARQVISPIQYLNHCRFINKETGEDYPKIIGYTNDLVYDQNEFNDKKIFAMVRNPFDWLVSYWGHAGGHDPRYENTEHYDYELSRKGFEYFVNAIADREGDIWPNRKFIHFALWSYDGKFMPDYIIYQNNLDNGLKLLADKFERVEYARQKADRVNSTRNRDYRTYYNDALAFRVHDIWMREIVLFDFSFDDYGFWYEKSLESSSKINQLKSSKYLYKTNELSLSVSRDEIKTLVDTMR